MIAEDLELIPMGKPERRRSPRPKPPPSHLAPRMRRLVDWLVELIEENWIARVVYALVCIASIASIYWSMTERIELIDQDYALAAERAVLQHEFDELAAHYSSDALQELLDRISSAETTVFADYASLASWLGDQANSAQTRGLTLSYSMHDTMPAHIKNVGEVPLTLSIRMQDDRELDAYHRVLGFLRQLVGTPWHLEMMDASIHGDGIEVVGLDATIHVWVATK